MGPPWWVPARGVLVHGSASCLCVSKPVEAVEDQVETEGELDVVVAATETSVVARGERELGEVRIRVGHRPGQVAAASGRTC